VKLTFVPTPQEFEHRLLVAEADQLEGTLTREWESRAELGAALDTEAGHDRYLLGALAIAAHDAGKLLGPGQVYDFIPPPILGGPIVVDSISVMDFVVSVDLTGQIHDQVRGLPPGAAVTELRVEGPKSKRRGLFRRR
jgi:hypothetical protein